MPEGVVIKEDLVRGSSGRASIDGVAQTRVFVVKNIPLAWVNERPSHLWHDILMEYGGTQLPMPGHHHPKIPHLICHEVGWEPQFENGKTSLKFFAQYRDWNTWIIRIDGHTITELTRRDSNGENMNLYYLPGGPANEEPKNNPASYKQLVQLEVLRPGLVLEFERPLLPLAGVSGEGGDAVKALDPQLVREAIGAENAQTWQGTERGTWLCEGMQATQLWMWGSPFAWKFAARFRFRGWLEGGGAVGSKKPIDTWHKLAWYIDQQTRMSFQEISPKDGGYPENKAGNGWKEFQLQPPMSFDDVIKFPEVFATAAA